MAAKKHRMRCPKMNLQGYMRNVFYLPQKLTRQWKITIFNKRYIFKWLVFHGRSLVFQGVFFFFCFVLASEQNWPPKITLPETNSSYLKIGVPKKEMSSSNHPFSGSLSFR